jgi:hypothetical protein
MDKLKITYGRTAYVQTGQEMLDLIEQSVGNWAEGQESVCVIRERLGEFLEEAKKSPEDYGESLPKLVEFIQAVVDGIEGDVGDIIFNC